MVAFRVRQTECALLEDRVRAVPQRNREAQPLLLVRDAAQPILAPAIGARPRLVVAEVVPGIAVVAVVLAHGAPLALGKIGPPALPGTGQLARVVQSFLCGRVSGRLRSHAVTVTANCPACITCGA